MNYELAKKLKDAGFPQQGNGEFQWYIDNKRVRDDVGMQATSFYFPTLSELIAACGDKFESLNNYNSERMTTTQEEKWKAVGSREEYYGLTPEIAVSNLWLAINKK